MQTEAKKDKAEKATRQPLLTWKDAGLAIGLSVVLACAAMFAACRMQTPPAEPRGTTAQSTHSPGFTLIELSIVLVIIGLIVGGVLAGQSLIKASQLRSVVTDIERLKTAVYTFRGKYDCLPGDCINASQFFGFYSNNAIVCSYDPSGTVSSCDGDGNGQIDQTNSLGAWQEPYTFWKHLSNAGYWPGSFTGASGDNSDPVNSIPAVNVPWSRYPNGAFSIKYVGGITSGAVLFYGGYGNMITLGAPVTGDVPNNSIMSPSDANSLDAKFDDGKPGTGTIRAMAEAPQTGNGACTGSVGASNTMTAVYANSSGVTCVMVFPNVF